MDDDDDDHHHEQCYFMFGKKKHFQCLAGWLCIFLRDVDANDDVDDDDAMMECTHWQ